MTRILNRVWPPTGRHRRTAMTAVTTGVLVSAGIVADSPTTVAIGLALPVFLSAREAYLTRRAVRAMR